MVEAGRQTFRGIRRLLGWFGAALVCTAVSAQPAVTITPPAPTAADEILAQIDVLVPGLCGVLDSTNVVGNLVTTTITVQNCFLSQPGVVQQNVVFGPLPAGTYTYDIYVIYEGDPPVLHSSHQIVVSAAVAPIPALGPSALVTLAAFIALAASLALRRVT